MGDPTIGEAVDLGIPGLDHGTLIGSGASARVYRSRQQAVDRPVAVKILGTRDPELLRRFRREARALGRVSRHAGIVTVYDYGETASGQPFLVLELCSQSLHDRILAEGELDHGDACAAALQIGQALAAAHEAGVIHRDIKPANILIDDAGRHLISDFGISTLVDTSSSHTEQVGFTAGYAPPEVFDGESKPGIEADLYALGATMVHMLTGRPPFFAETDEGLLAVLARIAAEPPPDVRTRGVPDDVAGLIDRLLAKAPADRPSIDEVIAELTVSTAEVATAEEPSDLVEGPNDEATKAETVDPAKVTSRSVPSPLQTDRLGNRATRRSMAVVAAAAVLAIAGWAALRDNGPRSDLDHGAIGSEAQANEGSGSGNPAVQPGVGDDGADRAGAPPLGPASVAPAAVSGLNDDDGADDAEEDGAEENGSEEAEPLEATSSTIASPSTTSDSTTTGLPSGSRSTATTPTTQPTTDPTSATSGSTETTDTTETTETSETTGSTITPVSGPSTSEGALVITSIEGEAEVPCGVGPRVFTALTNGVEVTSWAWSSQLRTVSPINDGPSLTVMFNGTEAGEEYRIRVRANNVASAFIDVTIIDGANC